MRFPLIIAIIMIPLISGASALEDLAQHQTFTAHRESSYDRSGGNGDAVPVPPGETKVLADIKGNGSITHIWFANLYQSRTGLRKLVIRAYFDGDETPCIEAPLGDFFGLGHAQTYPYASEPLAVATWGVLIATGKCPSRRAHGLR